MAIQGQTAVLLVKPTLCLYYDGEYREDDADFEPCFPIRREVAVDGVSVRTLPGGRGLTLIHREPYDQLGRSYAKILQHANERKFNLALNSQPRQNRIGSAIITQSVFENSKKPNKSADLTVLF